MKKFIYALILVFICSPLFAQLKITGVIDGPLTGGIPKAVEFYAINDIADLSVYGFGSANNGGGSDGEEFTFPAVSISAGTYIYVASEATGFTDFFGFAPDYTSGAANINGDDAIELFTGGSLVDLFGDINVDGTGEPWEYLDGWAKRVDGVDPNTTFTISEWTFSGPNALDGETTNSTAATPFPVSTPATSLLKITGVVDGPLSGGVPKAVEFYAIDDIADLSVYGFGSANNGGGSDGEEFTFPSVSITAGTYLYVASEATGFNSFFGFDPNYTSFAASINGDDAIELFMDGSVVDLFGDIDVDGSGQPWEYTDGWAKRVDEVGPNTTFELSEWTFSGPNALDGETTNSTAANPFPMIMPDIPFLRITGVVDGPLSGGVPKVVEFYAFNDISDLSKYGFGSANNGGGSDGEEFTFPAVSVTSGTYIYVASEAPGFTTFFGFAPDYTSSAANINGDDAIELFMNGEVIDLFGDINVDGTGQSWEYLDGWAKRLDDVGPNTTFTLAEWTFSGKNALDGETSNGTAANPFPITTTLAEIYEIQGPGLSSPLLGYTVITENNVVTALGTDGFFMQTPTSSEDVDEATSNGIFVFTNTTPSVAEGDLVNVTGTVAEFFDFTEITNPIVAVVGSAPLPAPVALDGTSPSPLQPQPDVEYEKLEGMLVSVENGIVTGPSQRFGSDPTAEAFVVSSLNRTFREPGIEYPGVSGKPVWDANPEVFELDPDKLGLPNQAITAGSTYEAVGVLGYEFGGYELWPKSLSINHKVLPVAVRSANNDELTVGSLNLFRLFETVSNYAQRLNKFSLYIRNVLNSPDILAVEEANSIVELEDLANKIQSDDPSIVYSAYLEEGNDIGGIDVGFLVKNEDITINSVTQLGKDDEYLNPETNQLNTLHDRPPLLLDASISKDGSEAVQLFVLAVHNRSLNEIETLRVQVKRKEQAESVAQMVQTIQDANTNVNIVVTGDFNAFEFTDGYVDVVGIISGNFDPSQSLQGGEDLVDPDLINQVLNVPANDRYSFIFRGTSQVLDHTLTSQPLSQKVSGIQFGRGNADAPLDLFNSETSPLRASDHDGIVLYLDITPPQFVLNDSQNLWPVNHKYQTFTTEDMIASLSESGTDFPLEAAFISKVTSDEPEDANGNGDGSTLEDIVIVDCQTVKLRAERAGNGNGRVYTVHLSAQDQYGNIGMAEYKVGVAHDKKAEAIDDGVAYEVLGECLPPTLNKSNADIEKALAVVEIPDEYSLYQNYPNPFNPTTRIKFDLKEQSDVTLKIFDMLGREISTLINEEKAPGTFEVNFDASDLPSGIYFYTIRANNFVQTKKMLLIK